MNLNEGEHVTSVALLDEEPEETPGGETPA